MSTGAVLIADDNADVCWLVADILRRDGYDVEVCSDPDVAIDRIERTEYSAILVEPSPAAAFRPFLARLSARTGGLGSVVLTTTEPGDETTVEWVGAFGVLHKPLTRQGILAAVGACAAHHDART